jgi:hypothetical protein
MPRKGKQAAEEDAGPPHKARRLEAGGVPGGVSGGVPAMWFKAHRDRLRAGWAEHSITKVSDKQAWQADKLLFHFNRTEGFLALFDVDRAVDFVLELRGAIFGTAALKEVVLPQYHGQMAFTITTKLKHYNIEVHRSPMKRPLLSKDAVFSLLEFLEEKPADTYNATLIDLHRVARVVRVWRNEEDKMHSRPPPPPAP